MKAIHVIFFLLIFGSSAIAQSYLEWDDYTVDEFYEKTDVPAGTLDQEGDDIDYIFVETDLDEGTYEIEITDGPGDLYEIKGTSYFIRFQGYYGYAGYGEEGILVVGKSYYSSTFYKED